MRKKGSLPRTSKSSLLLSSIQCSNPKGSTFGKQHIDRFKLPFSPTNELNSIKPVFADEYEPSITLREFSRKSRTEE